MRLEPRRFWILRSGNAAPEAVRIGAAEAADPLVAFSTESEIASRRTNFTRWPQWSRERWIASAAVAIAVLEAAFLLRGTVSRGMGDTPLLAESRGKAAAPVSVSRDILLPSAGEGSGVAATAGTVATLEVASEPSGARVSVDGQSRGVAPLRIAGLAPGVHEVILGDGTSTVSRRIRIEQGASSSLVVAMPKGNAAASGWVKLKLPILAQIYEGDELLGTTEVDRLMMPAGRHTLRLVNAALNYQTQQTVQVSAGDTRVLSLTLPTALVSINALPWAQVWIDGEAKGETPIGNLSVPIGSHEITLRHPQYGEQRRSVSVKLGGVTRVGVDLRR